MISHHEAGLILKTLPPVAQVIYFFKLYAAEDGLVIAA